MKKKQTNNTLKVETGRFKNISRKPEIIVKIDD